MTIGTGIFLSVLSICLTIIVLGIIGVISANTAIKKAEKIIKEE